MKEQANSLVMEAPKYPEQVGGRSTSRQARPAPGVADPGILVNFHDLPAGAIRYRLQFSALIFGVLFRRADANVECNPLDDDPPAEISCAIGL